MEADSTTRRRGGISKIEGEESGWHEFGLKDE